MKDLCKDCMIFNPKSLNITFKFCDCKNPKLKEIFNPPEHDIECCNCGLLIASTYFPPCYCKYIKVTINIDASQFKTLDDIKRISNILNISHIECYKRVKSNDLKIVLDEDYFKYLNFIEFLNKNSIKYEDDCNIYFSNGKYSKKCYPNNN